MFEGCLQLFLKIQEFEWLNTDYVYNVHIQICVYKLTFNHNDLRVKCL